MYPKQYEKVPCQALLGMPNLVQSRILRQSGGLASMSMSAPSYGRAAIQAALLLNGAASVALLAFLGNLAVAQQTKGLAGNFVTFKEAFVCFGIGVMLAAGSSVVAFLIQNVAIARPRQAEGRTGRRLRSVGIGMVVGSLSIFAVGITVAANALGNLVGSLDVASK
jgi:hypothetical protein